jgi:hypothetical protein
MGIRWKVILRFLFPVFMTVFMAAVLLAPRSAPERTPLFPPSSTAQRVVVELPFQKQQGVWQTEVPLIYKAPGEAPYGMALVFGTYGETLSGTTLEIVQGSSSCAFLEAKNVTLPDNLFVTIPASANCPALSADNPESRNALLRISIAREEEPHLALGVRVCDASCPPGSPVRLTVTTPKLIPDGWLESKPVAQSGYADRIAFLWGWEPKTLAAFLCVLVFIASLGFGFAADTFRASGRTPAWALAACAAGLALIYALLIPPFQAPDESKHFLGYAQLVGDHKLAEDFVAAAEKVHFARIVFREDQIFLDSDRSKPYTSYGDGAAVDYHKRSVTTPALWRALSKLAGPQDALGALLGLRMLAALLFGAALYLAGLLLRDMALYPLLLFPTLPFFAMAVSDHALAVSLAVLFAAFVLAFFFGREDVLKKPVFPLGFGLCCAAFFANTAAVFSLTLLLAFTLLVMALRRARMDETGPLQQAQYWGAWGLGLMGGLLFPADFMEPFFVRFQDMAAEFALPLPGPEWCLALLAFSLPPALWLAEKLLRSLHQKTPQPQRLWPRRASSFVLVGLALFFLVTALASPWSRVSGMPDIELNKSVTLTEYLGHIAENIATPFRLSHHDFFLTSSFLGGFGWLDVPFPEPLETFLLALVLAGFALLALRSWRAREEHRAMAVLALLGTIFVCIVASGYGTFHSGRINLHGRYLIAPYTLLIMLACMGFSRRIPEFEGKLSGVVRVWQRTGSLAWPLIFAVVYCITFVVLLTRYFGN